jgi:hypothetical protein
MGGPAQQSVTGSVFPWYNGSGLVIQCLARFQLMPSRCKVWRIVSMLTGWLTHALLDKQFQGPQAGLEAEVARRTMQHGVYFLDNGTYYKCTRKRLIADQIMSIAQYINSVASSAVLLLETNIRSN